MSLANSAMEYDEQEVYYEKQTTQLPDPYLYIAPQDEVGGVRTIYLTRTNIKNFLTLEDGIFKLTSTYSNRSQTVNLSINSSSLFFTNGIVLKYGNQDIQGNISGNILLGGINRAKEADFAMDYRGMIGARGLVPNSKENTIYLLPYPNKEYSVPQIKVGNQTLIEFLTEPLAESLNLKRNLSGKKTDGASVAYNFKLDFNKQKENDTNNYGDNDFITLSISDDSGFYEAIEFHAISPHDGEAGIYFNSGGKHVPLQALLDLYSKIKELQDE